MWRKTERFVVLRKKMQLWAELLTKMKIDLRREGHNLSRGLLLIRYFARLE